MSEDKLPDCPECGAGTKVRKYGYYITRKGHIPRFQCCKCGRQFRVVKGD